LESFSAVLDRRKEEAAVHVVRRHGV
jgi:hypothetical protein